MSFPAAERLQALIRALLESGGLTQGRETAEARELWAAVERGASRMHPPFDAQWFEGLLAAHPTPTSRSPSGRFQKVLAAAPEVAAVERAQDLGEAPDTTDFVGRDDELTLLRRWVLDERCRLLAILGMGGIGKTSLAARLVLDVAPSFERIYWRSLRDAPPLRDWLAGSIAFLSDQQLVPPAAESEGLAALLQLLRAGRCLLVLDNSEALIEPAQREGRYRDGMAGYGRLLNTVGDTLHQSCLILTSREAPPELSVLGEAVRTLELGGLGVADAQSLLAAKQLTGTVDDWVELNTRYGGNSLALKVIGETIRNVLAGDIGIFLQEEYSVFGDIRRLLAEQVQRSSALEQRVLRLLAVDREPAPIGQIIAELGLSIGPGEIIEAVEALRRRSLLERAEVAGPAAFTLQSVVLEYMTERLIESVADEIERGRPELLIEQPLMHAQAKDYIRQTQERLIGEPLVQRLKLLLGESPAGQTLLALLDAWRGQPAAEQAYGPGNVVNLLRLLRGDLRGLDLSSLALRQAYLAQVDAQDAKLVDAHLAETVLAEAFDFPSSVALSGDSVSLAAGTLTGEVWLWRVADRTPVWAVQGHPGGTWSVSLSADGELLVSGGADGTVRLWQASTGRSLATLHGHTGPVYSVAVSADGQLLVSGGADATIRLWETQTRQPIMTLQAHSGAVWAVAVSADGRLVVSGGADGTVRLWESATWRALATLDGDTGEVRGIAISDAGGLVASGGLDGAVRLWEAGSGECRATLPGHTGVVRSVALSANGRLLVTSGAEGAVRLWETGTGRPLANMQAHTGGVWGVALSADDRLLVSSGADGALRLWETGTGRPLATLQGRTRAIWGVALSSNGQLVASAGADGAVRLWETGTGLPLATLRGHNDGVWRVALSSDGELLVSCGFDRTVRLWETSTRRPVPIPQDHTDEVWAVALSADGQLVASGGVDGTLRLWERGSGRPVATLQGHSGGVRGIALSADGQLVASCAGDGVVRLWEADTWRPVATLHGHTGAVRSVALAADGRLVASGGDDRMVRLWETGTGRPVATLQGHTGTVYSVASSADAQLVASGGFDGTVRLWETVSGRPLRTLQGHSGVVYCVALSADGQLVVSGGFDGTVRLWEASTGKCLRVLQPDRPYERLDITDLRGITVAQRAALLALGAVERNSVRTEAPDQV